MGMYNIDNWTEKSVLILHFKVNTDVSSVPSLAKSGNEKCHYIKLMCKLMSYL